MLISDGAEQMELAPWLLIFPSIMAVTLFCFNFIGDGLRDALDPKVTDDPLLEITDLNVRFATADGDVHAVKKSTRHGRQMPGRRGRNQVGQEPAFLAALGLLAANGRTSGSVQYRGQEILGLRQSG